MGTKAKQHGGIKKALCFLGTPRFGLRKGQAVVKGTATVSSVTGALAVAAAITAAAASLFAFV